MKNIKCYAHFLVITCKTRYDYNLPILKYPKPTPMPQWKSWSVLLNVSYH